MNLLYILISISAFLLICLFISIYLIKNSFFSDILDNTKSNCSDSKDETFEFLGAKFDPTNEKDMYIYEQIMDGFDKIKEKN